MGNVVHEIDPLYDMLNALPENSPVQNISGMFQSAIDYLTSNKDWENKPEQLLKEFVRLSEAYAILGYPKTRNEYHKNRRFTSQLDEDNILELYEKYKNQNHFILEKVGDEKLVSQIIITNGKVEEFDPVYYPLEPGDEERIAAHDKNSIINPEAIQRAHTPYQLLGVGRNALPDEIIGAYVNIIDQIHEKIKTDVSDIVKYSAVVVSEAFGILGTPRSRLFFDQNPEWATRTKEDNIDELFEQCGTQKYVITYEASGITSRTELEIKNWKIIIHDTTPIQESNTPNKLFPEEPASILPFKKNST